MQDILHKTLIIRFSSVGDIVLSSPLVRVLRRRFPLCQIDYLVKDDFADLVRQNPYLSHVIEFPAGGTIGDLLRVRRRIVAEKYDLLIDIHGSLRSRLLCFGARRVVRINKRLLARFLLVHAKRNLYRRLGGASPVAERYLETVAAYGIGNDNEGLDLFVGEEDDRRATQILRESGITAGDPLLGICPSAKHGNKIWPQERFVEAALALAHDYGTPVALFGSENEIDRCSAIERGLHNGDASLSVVNFAGRASLAVTAALMDRCLLVLTNDSGLMHIAAARKRAVVAVFGPTVRELGFFPYGTRNAVVERIGLSCRPCTHIGLAACPKGHFKCMKDIAAEQVLDAARHLAPP